MRKIAGYELVEDLGRNAWGHAWRARQVSLDRPVSLTLLDPGSITRSVEMLARASAAVTHPHLVSGIDFGEEEGRIYLVTEWLEGPSVGELVARGGPLDETRALEIGLAAAQALDYAARKSLVHGNLSPAAIVITSGSNPKVRGFGADRESVRWPEDYRSPEQKKGRATDVRSDIYSLGLVLHYVLTGRYPFEEAPPAEVVGSEVVEVPAPLAEHNRRLAPETAAVVERMTAFRAEDRPRDGGALAEALEAALSRLDERVEIRSSRPARPAPRRPRTVRPRRRRRR